jgi:hypothetical protein
MSAQHAPTDRRILEIRKWIDAADARGDQRSDLELHLSHRDACGLKRSPAVRTDEISFLDGVMRFLGVQVVAAGASTSTLERRAGA